jgi:hypothetical protein
MNEITLQSRCRSILGLPDTATDGEILAKVKQVAKEAEGAVISDREREIREMMETMNASRATANFVLAEREREKNHPMPRQSP